ncbi:unnamed protein product [Pocillopora meandrina]|uniref:Uncharacterized protein n=1 Tax=Pocillopora meandrina TaxID=46732 RepID=A0AAU9VQC8_9CNID|nr:unnamed protein product [Pocillopora meandrina]
MEKDPTKIVEVLAEGNVKISCWGVIKFLQIFQEMPHQRIQPEDPSLIWVQLLEQKVRHMQQKLVWVQSGTKCH